MSVDPAAANAAAAASAAAEAVITAELNALAADAQALQQQVAVGDVVQATVLPSNGLTDLINILGNRVAANLPPTLTPGEQITVQVTGFNGTQILLQLLSSSEGSPTSTPATAPPIPLPVTDPPTSSTTAPAGSTSYTPTSTTTGLASPVPATPLAPPASAFVAATVRPNAPVPPPVIPGQTAGDPPENATPGSIPGAAGTTLPAQVFGGIEARLAASRAASVQVLVPSSTPAAALRPPPAPFVPPPSTPPTAGGPPRGIAPPPPIVTARFANAPLPAADPAAPAPAANGQAPAQAPAPARTAASYQDPLALVRALELSVTPSNLAAARLALDAPQRLPAALATLESALPETDDPRVTTLRTLTAFVGKIEPSSPQLATQIAAYVEHVVGGSEPQLAQLLRAYADESPVPVTTPDAAAAAADVAAAEAAPAPAEAAGAAGLLGGAGAAPETVAAASEPPLPVVAMAQIAERSATIAVSLKEQIFSLITGPALTGRGTDVLAPAAASALSAVTSVQLAAAQAAVASPQTLSFAIPMWLGASGYAQAQLSVDRDAPDTPNVPMDGDNFHIAFVLDTKHLGTVAIDLRMVGREFSLSVKTENLRTAQRFGDELSRLTDRLSSLRYRPASVEAVVALGGPAPDAAPAAPIPAIVTDPIAPAPAPTTEFNESA